MKVGIYSIDKEADMIEVTGEDIDTSIREALGILPRMTISPNKFLYPYDERIVKLLDASRITSAKVVHVVTNDLAPDQYNYKYLDVVLEDDSTERFHYHINNPMPTEDEMIGRTWEQVCKLARKMFYDKLEANSKARQAEAQDEK